MSEGFPQIDAVPYAWPFDGRWTAEDTALLLLGFQAGTVASLGAEAETAVAARLAKAARTAGLAVIATRRGRGTIESAVARRRAELGDRLQAVGAPDWELARGLALGKDAEIIDHSGDNAFYGSNLEGLLRARGVSRLLIAGLPTEGLLHATMRTANDMGLEALAISDATKATTPERRIAQLRITAFGNGLFGAHAETAQVLRALGA